MAVQFEEAEYLIPKNLIDLRDFSFRFPLSLFAKSYDEIVMTYFTSIVKMFKGSFNCKR